MARIRNKTVKKQAKAGAKIHLKYVRSAICAPTKHKVVIKGLGFTRLNQVIEREDTLSIRGMVAKVPHLVEIVGEGKSEESESPSRSAGRRGRQGARRGERQRRTEMNLSSIRKPKGSNTKNKRIGRGMGSGMGKTSTRGHKGQGSRSGSQYHARI